MRKISESERISLQEDGKSVDLGKTNDTEISLILPSLNNSIEESKLQD